MNPAPSPSDLPPPPARHSGPEAVGVSPRSEGTTPAAPALRAGRFRSAMASAICGRSARRFRPANASAPALPSRRFRPAKVTAAAVLAGAVVVGPAAILPAAADTTSPAAAIANPAANPALTSEEHGYPGYFSGLSVVEDELSAEANHLTVQADFCLHPGATAEDVVGFDIMWDAPISNWERLVGLDERYTSSVPVTDDSGDTVLTADLVFSVTDLGDDWGQELKTSVDLHLAPGAAPGDGAAPGAGSCGTLELPIAAPLALADVVESQPEDPADHGDPTDPDFGDVEEFDPFAYTVYFVDQDGRRSSDVVRLNPTELPVREAWVSGELDFTGSTHWVLLTQSGPAGASETAVVLRDGTLCREPYEALIIDSSTLMPTNQEPDLDVSCEDGTKTFTLENRLRADRQLVVSQFDPRPGAAAVAHELTADLITGGVTERRTAQVISAAPAGRLTGPWTAPEACPAPFADNALGAPAGSSTSAYHRDIRWMQCWSITEGYADNTYRAGRSISRGESVAFLHRYTEQVGEAFPLLSPGEASLWDEFEQDPFQDVGEDHPFAEPIAWAVGQGLTYGYADGTFGPARPVTRGELAAFTYRLVDAGYSGYEPGEDAPFSDVPAEHAFATEIGWLAEQEVLNGYGDGTFRPGQRISRGEVARVLTQLHEQLVQR
ncbi:S-layer homology domain-containing protein [Citricoccus sp. I39-566]|uniref:S-layer homology domain-containing protein n=1 Tax=Citricoccus sp. I39-566 TaxID=3073268 RepID=UPI00286AF179|nr:S-layer homology domain-containing protein [Citricoccus sp. I39-566]WMY78118.1 S-layer homology domain-containing protein [Citricoccus sp. I39-566]